MLYAEDEEDDVFFMRRACARTNFAAALKIVPDGQATVDYLAGTAPFRDRTEHPFPSVVALDLNLPILSGLEVLRWIRLQPELSGLVVVVLTSSNQASDLERAYKLGANSYLLKPCVPAEFEALVLSLYDYWFVRNQRPPSLGRDRV